MKPQSEIRRLRVWALSTLALRRQEILHLHPPLSGDERRVVALAALGAASSWAVFLRSYYLSAMTGGVCAGGHHVGNGVGVVDLGEAITFAVHATKPSKVGLAGPWSHRDEPDWTDPGIVARLLAQASATIAPEVGAAVSIGSSARQDLATFRNYVAHQNRDTALKVRALGVQYRVSSGLAPIEIPLQAARHRPQSLLADWLDDLWAIVSFMPY